MTALHVLLATLVAVIWGAAFVASKVALEHFSPPQLVTLRFLIAALPALVLRRPPVPWSALLPIGLTWFTGQFLLQFFGIALGMPPGLAAVAVQTQALFTVLLAAWALREPVSRRQGVGMALAFGGLALGERFGHTRLAGMALVLPGLAVLVWPRARAAVAAAPPG